MSDPCIICVAITGALPTKAHNPAKMRANGAIAQTPNVQFVIGVKNAMPADRDVFDFYVRTVARLFPGAPWRAVGDATLRALYEIARIGPTSMNQQPVRVIFVHSSEAKDRLAPALFPTNRPKMRAGAVLAVDALALRLTLGAPDIAIVSNLLDYQALMVHPSFDAAKVISEPVGTGPYLPGRYDVGQIGVLDRNENHTWWTAGNGV